MVVDPPHRQQGERNMLSRAEVAEIEAYDSRQRAREKEEYWSRALVDELKKFIKDQRVAVSGNLDLSGYVYNSLKVIDDLEGLLDSWEVRHS
jgi:hypothetical protein